jgi:hypothetical protein
MLLGCALGLTACLFDGGSDTVGLPCEKDSHCGEGLECLLGFCGGPQDFGDFGEAGDGGDAADGDGGVDDGDGGVDDGDGGVDDGDGDGTPPGACSASDPLTCTGSNTVRYCDAGQLAEISCDDVCEQDGQLRSWGCRETSSGDGCWCDPNSAACSTVDAVECYDGVNARQCTTNGWQAVDCDIICADGLGSTTGCEPTTDGVTCQCTETCVDGAQYCDSDSTIRVCEGGVWNAYDCTNATCGSGEPVGCAYINGGDTCVCLG